MCGVAVPRTAQLILLAQVFDNNSGNGHDYEMMRLKEKLRSDEPDASCLTRSPITPILDNIREPSLDAEEIGDADRKDTHGRRAR